jgi:hypothetical protein
MLYCLYVCANGDDLDGWISFADASVCCCFSLLLMLQFADVGAFAVFYYFSLLDKNKLLW